METDFPIKTKPPKKSPISEIDLYWFPGMEDSRRDSCEEEESSLVLCPLYDTGPLFPSLLADRSEPHWRFGPDVCQGLFFLSFFLFFFSSYRWWKCKLKAFKLCAMHWNHWILWNYSSASMIQSRSHLSQNMDFDDKTWLVSDPKTVVCYIQWFFTTSIFIIWKKMKIAREKITYFAL